MLVIPPSAMFNNGVTSKKRRIMVDKAIKMLTQKLIDSKPRLNGPTKSEILKRTINVEAAIWTASEDVHVYATQITNIFSALASQWRHLEPYTAMQLVGMDTQLLCIGTVASLHEEVQMQRLQEFNNVIASVVDTKGQQYKKSDEGHNNNNNNNNNLDGSQMDVSNTAEHGYNTDINTGASQHHTNSPSTIVHSKTQSTLTSQPQRLVTCPECGSNDIDVSMAQTRSGDEGMTTFMRCGASRCGWQEAI